MPMMPPLKVFDKDVTQKYLPYACLIQASQDGECNNEKRVEIFQIDISFNPPLNIRRR